MPLNRHSFLLVFISLVAFSCGDTNKHSPDWPEYLGGPDRNHYSSLDQINVENVSNLGLAWEYHTQDSGQIQCNPIVVGGVLYAMTASVQPFALDAATGREIWRVRDTTGATWYGTSRGLSYWQDHDDKRILYTKDSLLYAVNALTGKPVTSFGSGGQVSLKAGLGPTAENKFVVSNTPGTVFEDLIIMPLRVSEGADAAPGYIQAFNIRNGKVEWVFKTIPDPGEPGYDTWPEEAYKNTNVGAANNWSGMAIDKARGIVYVPTGSAAFDFYGGARHGSNLFANTLLALDARSGKRIWHFQFVHHDILDRDAPAPPNLVTVTRGGKRIDAVAQVTKHAYVYLFDRVTGESLFPIREVVSPASDIPGEEAWLTQPLPEKPLPYARQSLTEDDISPYAKNRDELIETFRKSRYEGPFTPLTRNGTIIFPGLDGGAEWGGVAVDPDGIMYINSNEMAWLISLDEAARIDAAKGLTPGQVVYNKFCVSCHGSERKGNPASGFPPLIDVAKRLDKKQLSTIITSGRAMMPAFKSLPVKELNSLMAFLFNEKEQPLISDDKKEPGIDESPKEPDYKISGYTKFLDSDGNPAISPPWGTLNAIDLNTGEYVWKNVFGEYPELQSQGVPQTGSESYGGPVVTAGGLLFIAGTKDRKLRVYNKKDGELLWETTLPAAGFATPSTYEVDGKQYVAVACGGTKLGAEKGDSYVAFTLGE